MGKVLSLSIRNYRSVSGPLEIRFPREAPVVLVGPNNAGKSNIVRALDLVFGESWPGNHEPDDHEFFDRDRSRRTIEICAELAGVTYQGQEVEKLTWRCASAGADREDGREVSFKMAYAGQSRNVNGEVRDQCVCVLVGADRRLSYHLSYQTRWTFLSRLMRHFHRALTTDPSRLERLQELFAQVKGIFGEVEEFTEFSEELSRNIGELSGGLRYGLTIDFSSYDPSNYFHALRLLPHEDDAPRTFEELGTGQQQILALAFASAYAKAFHGSVGGLILAVEEPEANLHPLAQRWVAQKLRELAQQGVQVVITTHSPAFTDVMGLEGMVLVRKGEDGTRTAQLTSAELAAFCRDHGAVRAEADKVLDFYAAAATEEIMSGFFANKIVLVEGPSEALALPLYLRSRGFDATAEGIAFIPVYGVGNLAKWWRLFSAYEIPVYVAFDNDSKEDKDGKRRIDILSALQVEQSRMSDLLNTDGCIVEDKFCVFGRNFEETLRRHFGTAYERLEQQAREMFQLSADASKPLVAKYVAENIELPLDGEGTRMLSLLADKIASLKPSD